MSMANHKLIGAILAGGKSRRMGSDKALLPVAGGTLLEWMQGKLKRAGIEHILVCGSGPQSLPDAIANLGPLGALHTLAETYPDHVALIVPVDMPLLEPRTLMELVAQSNVTAPRHYLNYFFPLLLPLHATTADYLRRTVAQPHADHSIAACLRALGATTIDPGSLISPIDDATFLNINTPEQWRSVVTRLK